VVAVSVLCSVLFVKNMNDNYNRKSTLNVNGTEGNHH
jgi:hypothetical protein